MMDLQPYYMPAAIAGHLIAAVIWVGGMFFAYVCLRPAAQSTLDPPQRLRLWSVVFQHFFVWVWAAIITILVSGYWMIFIEYDGFDGVVPTVKIMHITGLLMMLVFFHVFFAPYRRLKQYVATEDFAAAGKQLGQIRILVAINLGLGLITVIIASAGPFLLFITKATAE